MKSGEWFVIQSGEHEGRAHLMGWMHSALRTAEDRTSRGIPSPWWAFANCPRCFAVVSADENDAYGDMTWEHERWHAVTDYPIPEHVAQKVTRP